MASSSLSLLELTTLAWLAFSSLLAFVVFGWDKWRAKRNGRRVPETTLAMLGAIGGWPGGLAGMLVFRHKTAKPAFWLKYALGLPVFLGLVYLSLRFFGRMS